jgi:hypothetical protein
LKENLESIQISLDANKRTYVYIRLSEDGTINRMGNGSVHETQPVMIAGRVSTPVFRSFMDQLSDHVFDRFGDLMAPGPWKGDPGKLTFVFRVKTGEVFSVSFSYGLESVGPPQVYRDAIVTALKLTEDWYQREKSKPASM